MNKHNLEDWLSEADIPAAGGQPDPAGMQAPMTDPQGDPNAANIPQQGMEFPAPEDDDVNDDPQAPDMPEEDEKEKDFEVWKNDYFKAAIKGDVNEMMELLGRVRDNDLTAYQRKFVEDNWDIQLLRQNSNIEKAGTEIRRNIKSQLDKNNPATSVVSHIVAVLGTEPYLATIPIKLNGYIGIKGDLHRKYIASLIGAVQVGSGAGEEDIIYNEKDYSILISTRFNSKWGNTMLGNWSLKEDDADRYLSDSELERLKYGSPEEKDVLRRRIVMESISDLFETRAFIVNVVGENGTIYMLGWDVATSLRNAYSEGKLVVKTRKSDQSEAMITDEGEIVPFLDLNIYYVKETGELRADGKPEKKELKFIERRDGMLFLTAGLQLLSEAAGSLQGVVFKEIPYNGNPSDLKVLQRCVYSAHDMLMKQC